jgi:hypothetical protein
MASLHSDESRERKQPLILQEEHAYENTFETALFPQPSSTPALTSRRPNPRFSAAGRTDLARIFATAKRCCREMPRSPGI